MTAQIHDATREALLALINGYEAGYRKQHPTPISEELSSAFRQTVITAFSSLNILTDKLKLMDEAFDAFPIYKPLQEYGFDLMMINFLAHDSKRLDEDYLESAEWEQIESKTIDRGTELLNILLYLAEAKGNEVAPGIQDFLYEYLLVDDDLYQDEFFIYEPLIKNQQHTDAEPQELATIASKIKQDELKPIFLPLMLFFHESITPQDGIAGILQYGTEPAEELAVYQALVAFQEFC